jgi:hypothetical protein
VETAEQKWDEASYAEGIPAQLTHEVRDSNSCGRTSYEVDGSRPQTRQGCVVTNSRWALLRWRRGSYGGPWPGELNTP